MKLVRALGLERARLVALSGAGGKTSLLFALAREWAAAGERVLVTTTTRLARDEVVGRWPAGCAVDAPAVIDRLDTLLPTGGLPGIAVVHAGECDGGAKLAGLAPEVIDRLHAAAVVDRIVVEADGAARRPLKAPAAHEPVIPSACDALVAVAGLQGLGQPLDETQLFRTDRWIALTGATPGTPIRADDLARVACHPDGLARGCPAGVVPRLYLNRADTEERRRAVDRIAGALAAMPGCPFRRLVAGWLLPEPTVVRLVLLPAAAVAAAAGRPLARPPAAG